MKMAIEGLGIAAAMLRWTAASLTALWLAAWMPAAHASAAPYVWSGEGPGGSLSSSFGGFPVESLRLHDGDEYELEGEAFTLGAGGPTASLGAGSIEGAKAAAAAPGDRAATHKLLEAGYELAKTILARAPAVEAAATRAAKALGHECRGVLRGVPDESVIEEEEGSHRSRPRLSGRVQGERARSELEKLTIELAIGETISAPAHRVLRGPYDAYIVTADRLNWSDPTINALVHEQAARLREELVGPRVAVCAEMRAWAASGFHVLPPRIKRLEEGRGDRSKRAAQGNLEALLRPYEGPADREIAGRIRALTEQLREQERTDERLSSAWYHMELALGEKLSRFTEQRLAPVIARGRTHAGTTFVIRRSVGKRSRGSCRREVEVEVREGSGGSWGGLCLSQRGRSRPSGSCSGPRPVVETIQLATPPDVRRARVRLSDGRTVTVPVVHVPAKDGGPAGVFIDAFRGYRPYPVSVQELSRDGRVLRTVGLREARCRKELAEAPNGPQFVDLATVTAPSGEPLTISGTLFRFRGQTEFSLGPQLGMRNSEAGEEEDGKPKQFQWDLSTECAPHPYSLLVGILLPPGTSVLARTPTGLAPLTRVELSASMHAGGPLFYGVYSTPPTEVVVERSDGSVLYTESLAAKATEETEFCEGYAER